MSNYRAGAELERSVKHSLESNGYLVFRSAGSKGVADLVALKPGEILFIQAKTDGYLRPKEREMLWQAAAHIGAVPLTAAWVKHGRAARTVGLFRMTGTGDYEPWTPDYAVGAEP